MTRSTEVPCSAYEVRCVLSRNIEVDVKLCLNPRLDSVMKYCYESKCLTPYQELGLYKISRNGRVCFIYTAVCVSALPKNTYLAMCEGSQLREWLLFFGLPILCILETYSDKLMSFLWDEWVVVYVLPYS